MDDVALLDEIDNKLLVPTAVAGSAPGGDPILLAVHDLAGMRDGDKPIRREEIEAQRASFASNPPLFEYLLAAHDFYVANKPDAVLAAIPAVKPQAPLSHLEFSRQMLRGMALAALKDRNEAGFWRELLNSDGSDYGGSGMGNQGGRLAELVPTHGRPASLSLVLPPLAALVLKAEACPAP